MIAAHRRHRSGWWPACAMSPSRSCSTPRNCCACRSASGRHTAERDVLAVVVADLSDEKPRSERPWWLRTAFYMPAVDGKCDRSCFGRRSRGWQRRRFSSSRAPTCSVRWRIVSTSGVSPSGKELIEQRAGAAVWQHAAHLGDGAFIVRRAAVGHDLRDWGEGPARRHATSAGVETGGANLHDAIQRRQPPTPEVLEWTLRATIVTARRRRRQCSSACARTRWRCAARPGSFSSSATVNPNVSSAEHSAVVGPAGAGPCSCTVPSAPASSIMTSPLHPALPVQHQQVDP